jgi:outer membrane protein assembly factor BamB
LLLAPGSGAIQAGDWPQFRGPGGQGLASGAGWPLRWSERENIVWKTPIPGRGWSSPVVSGQRVWLTTALDTPADGEVAKRVLAQKGKDVPGPLVASHVTLKAVCVDLESGRALKDVTVLEVDGPVVICSTNTYASPTPVLEAGRLYCDFGSMGTACLDAESGEVLWRRRLPVDHQVGPGSSPVVHGRLLVLVRDGIDAQYLIALDKATGETAWKQQRPAIGAASPSFCKAFSTPLVLEFERREQLISTGARWIVSYEPATGKELWRVDAGFSFSNTTRPVAGGGLVIAGTSFPASLLRAIRPGGSGDVTATHVQWQHQRAVPKQSSPLLAGEELYLVADNGIASCLDPRSGAVHWTQRLPGGYSASPVFAEGRVYCFSEDGRTTVLRAGKEYEKLAENQLDGRTMASPAFVDQAIVLRTERNLYCIRAAY